MNTWELIKNSLLNIRDMIYPQRIYCICCRKPIDEGHSYSLCSTCMNHIHWYDGTPLPHDEFEAYSCMSYGLYERTIVFNLKYNGNKYIAKEMAEIMHDRLELERQVSAGHGIKGISHGEDDLGHGIKSTGHGGNRESHGSSFDYDIIVPVPMHPKKQRQRGFNQAALLGEYLARLEDKECLPQVLIRTQNTKPMRGLGAQARRENIKNIFALNPKFAEEIKGKNLLLLDDIYTTGSTARECGLMLAAAGAATIKIFVFAAGRNDGEETLHSKKS